MPEYLVGKTAAEAASLMNDVVTQNQRLAQQSLSGRGAPNYGNPVPPPATPYAYQPNFQPPQNTAIAKPTAEDFIQRPQEATEQYAAYLEQTRWNPQFQATAASQAQLSREMVALRRPDDFKRYGPEIDLALQKIAPDASSWTPENINYVVDMVRGRHVEDLLAEERQKHQNPLGGVSPRSDGGGTPGSSPAGSNAIDLEKFPVNYQAALKRANLDQHSIDEFLIGAYVKSGMEPTLEAARERWTAQVMRGDVITDGKEYLSGIYK